MHVKKTYAASDVSDMRSACACVFAREFQLRNAIKSIALALLVAEQIKRARSAWFHVSVSVSV